MAGRDAVLNGVFAATLPQTVKAGCDWTVEPEASDPTLLSKLGGSQPTSIDALRTSSHAVVKVESKFATDAAHGFGGCSQAGKSCKGYDGQGSDTATKSAALCRLEHQDGRRGPRADWHLGRTWFRPDVFIPQTLGQTCRFDGPNYQLMRNFLYAATLAARLGKPQFGALTIGPRRHAAKLQAQVETFRQTALQKAYSDLIAFTDYETCADLLAASPQARKRMAAILAPSWPGGSGLGQGWFGPHFPVSSATPTSAACAGSLRSRPLVAR